jgi:hypothetical protein
VRATELDIWSYRAAVDENTRITGYEVEATDGSIGTVDDASYEAGGSYIVVDTGPWIFGRRVMLPAGVVDTVDTAAGRVYVNATKEQVKASPEFDPEIAGGAEYRQHLATYYAGTTPGAA